MVDESFLDTFPAPVIEVDNEEIDKEESDSDDGGDSDDDDVPYWLFLAGGQERPVEPKAVGFDPLVE